LLLRAGFKKSHKNSDRRKCPSCSAPCDGLEIFSPFHRRARLQPSRSLIKQAFGIFDVFLSFQDGAGNHSYRFARPFVLLQEFLYASAVCR
jgi:hypothetical protein